MDKTLLKQVLSVPTCYRNTGAMVRFIQKWLTDKGIPHYTDHLGNVYATKGTTKGFYPAVCAHTDTVHHLDNFVVMEEDGNFVAYDNHLMRCGLGGDDKAGVYVCMELLMHAPALKAAFFVDEEIGCLGSKEADPRFFADVGYCIEFDSPNNDILSFSCDGVQLLAEDGPLLAVAEPILKEYGAVKWQYHPYTDVAQLRRKFDFECLNLPCGYYHMHSEHEYVCIEDTARAIRLGKALLGALGCCRYWMPKGNGLQLAERLNVTRLACD